MTLDYLVPVNNTCNQRCNFCSAAHRMGSNRVIPFKNILRDILSKERYIQISGGEPLMHPKIFSIVAFIRKYKKGCFIELQSNGLLLLKNGNLEKLMRLHVDLFNINYPSHIEEINDEIVGIEGTLSVREEAMRMILRLGGKLRINVIVNRYNYRYMGEMVEYIYHYFPGLERIQFSFAKSMGAADSQSIVPTYEEAGPYFVAALAKCEQYSMTVDVDHIPICFLGNYHRHHIDHQKKLLGEHGIFEEEKCYVSRCSGCEKKRVCSGYRKDYLGLYSG